MVYKVLILGVQNQRLKENLKRVAWGLDVGREDRTRINLLCLRLIYFLKFISFCAILYLTLIILCFGFVLTFILDPTIHT